jgi:hypothetical protein
MANGERADRSVQWRVGVNGARISEAPGAGKLSSGVSRCRPVAGGGRRMEERRLEPLEAPPVASGSTLARLLSKLGGV